MKRLHDLGWRGFASDNYAGAHPEVLAAIERANGGHQISYGEDVYTQQLIEVMRERFGAQEVFPVFNGTGANVTALMSLVPRWGAVVTAKTAVLPSCRATVIASPAVRVASRAKVPGRFR